MVLFSYLIIGDKVKNNYKVIVDAGHGGEDPGAIGNNISEKDLNLRAAQYMYKRLQELNIPSVIIRDKDETLPKNERIKRVLEAFNNEPNTILISNHMNAGGGEGAEIIYALRNDNTLATLALDNIGKKGQKKRTIYQRVLPEDPSKDYYYILRETKNTEPLLIEYGFIDNKNDIQKLNNNLENYVEGVVEAIAQYTGYKYTPPKEENYYIVKSGDTLYKIANMYNLSVDELKELNSLTSNIISIGQKLLIEKNIKPNTIVYTVQKGDSLWRIAKNFNTTVDDLIKLNNLSTINLQIGDKLLIPIPINNIYTIKKGDTLWSIAKSNNTTVDIIKQLNSLTSNLLSVGDTLILP